MNHSDDKKYELSKTSTNALFNFDRKSKFKGTSSIKISNNQRLEIPTHLVLWLANYGLTIRNEGTIPFPMPLDTEYEQRQSFKNPQISSAHIDKLNVLPLPLKIDVNERYFLPHRSFETDDNNPTKR